MNLFYLSSGYEINMYVQMCENMNIIFFLIANCVQDLALLGAVW